MIGFDQHFLVYDLVNYFKFQSFQPANSDLMLGEDGGMPFGGIGVISTFFLRLDRKKPLEWFRFVSSFLSPDTKSTQAVPPETDLLR